MPEETHSEKPDNRISYTPEKISLQEFNQRFVKDFPDPVKYKKKDIKYLDRVNSSYQLTKKEHNRLLEHNMIVSERLSGRSFGSVFYNLYHNEIPVLITTDAILFALHSTYDSLLADIERYYCRPALTHVLTKMHENLEENKDELLRSGISGDCLRDIDLYLAIGKTLLNIPQSRRYSSGDSIEYISKEDCIYEETVTNSFEIIDMIKAKKQVEIQLFGTDSTWNFGEFEPMGHYRSTKIHRSYWRAMVWLRKADFDLSKKHQFSNALLVSELMKPVQDDYQKLESLIDLLVGKSDKVTITQLDQICNSLEIDEFDQRIKQQENIWISIKSDENLKEQICGRIQVGTQSEDRKNLLPTVAGMFGKRWVIDSYVNSQVIFDRVKDQNDPGKNIKRFHPSGLDLAFVLGNDRAAKHLTKELTRFPYQHNLLGLRNSVDQLNPEFWDQTFYNIWLKALSSLSQNRLEQNYPKAMQTSDWQDKMLNTQLTGFTQVRHANQLYNPHSFSAGCVCEFPEAYVEPYPEFYRILKVFAEKSTVLFQGLTLNFDVQPYKNDERQRTRFDSMIKNAQKVFDHWVLTMGMLEDVSRAELSGKKLTKEQRYFIQDVMEYGIYPSGGSGPPPEPLYSGWYPKLFYPQKKKCQDPKPLVVAANYDPNAKNFLIMGTGMVNLCLTVIEIENQPIVFCGPVNSYYEFIYPKNIPLTDEKWREHVEGMRRNKLKHKKRKEKIEIRTSYNEEVYTLRPEWEYNFVVASDSVNRIKTYGDKILAYMNNWEAKKRNIGESVWAFVYGMTEGRYHCDFIEEDITCLVMPEGTPEGYVHMNVKIENGVENGINITRSTDKRLSELSKDLVGKMAFFDGRRQLRTLRPVVEKNNTRNNNKGVCQIKGKKYRKYSSDLIEKMELELHFKFERMIPR
ncbi:MAG: DUF3160 domain-containing protein [Candidatus Hatepunaea meridiana]|nr:DUF3160 domain-containing protein [Candidatus Hatepunaea meridiana]